MDFENIPALQHINLAREHAKLENYDASLRSFQNAKTEIQIQIQQGSDPTEISKWNLILKDLIAEETLVLKIKNIFNEIINNISIKKQKEITNIEK